MKKSTFARRLKALREQSDLTQSELCRLAKIHPSMISRYESGTKEPSFKTLVKLAAAFEVSAAYLMGY